MKPAWMNTVTWIAIAVLALILAVMGPKESSVMGKLRLFHGNQQPDHTSDALPPGFGAERTLALISFSKDHRPVVEGWIKGLQLQNDPSIAWVRMPVLNDPGNAAGRGVIENRIRARYPTDQERANLLPVFTDRAAFVQSAGLSNTEHAYVLVINRQGEVLARVEGPFDEDKAQALRETLTMQGL